MITGWRYGGAGWISLHQIEKSGMHAYYTINIGNGKDLLGKVLSYDFTLIIDQGVV